jgi:hypothetical protein
MRLKVSFSSSYIAVLVFSEKESGLSQARTPHNVKFLDCPKMDNGLPMGDSPF